MSSYLEFERIQISGSVRGVPFGSTRPMIKGVPSVSRIQLYQSAVFLPHQIKFSPITNQKKPYGHLLFIFLNQNLNHFYVPTTSPINIMSLKKEQRITHIININIGGYLLCRSPLQIPSGSCNQIHLSGI